MMENEHERLLEELRTPYFLIHEGRVEFLNGSASAQLGYTPGDIVGKPFSQLCAPRTREEWSKAHQEILTASKAPGPFSGILLAADGSEIPVEVTAWATTYRGKPAIAQTTRAIEEREETEGALRESQEKLRVMLESIAEGIVVIDLDSRIADMNGVMLRLYGYAHKEDVVGRSVFEFLSPKDKNKAIDNMQKTLWEGYRGNLELTFVNRHGHEYEVEISGAPLRDKSGRPVGLIAVTRDITERKRAQEEIRHRLLFEELIATLSTKFINYTPEEIDGGIVSALQSIAEFSGVDRSHVCLLTEDGTRIEKTYEWCAEGIESNMANLQGVTAETAPWWVGKLKRLENIQVSTVTELPESARIERDTLGLDTVRSSLTVPMHHGTSLIGILGFHSIRTEKIWSDEDIALLKIIGETFVNALARKQAEEALREAEELNRVLVETAAKAGEGLAVFQEREGNEAICVFVNDEFARIVGYAIEELLGQSPPNTISPEVWRGRLKVQTEKKASQEARPRIELDLFRKDGQTIPVDIGIGNTTYQGKPATVLYMTDISERRRQEAENLQLQETLRLYSNQVVRASKELLHAIREFHARESMVQAIAGQRLFKRTTVPHPEPVRIGEVELLTAREIQVLQLAARGLSNKDIGAELGITVRTVKGHLLNIYAKMNVRSRTEAVSCALQEGWIRLEDMGQRVV